ncbi:hypothetical protein ACEPAF_6048 [Sanghuangporus sanghuang]
MRVFTLPILFIKNLVCALLNARILERLRELEERKAHETFDAEALSATHGSRFSSPAPSCQMRTPSLYLRERTPFSETSDSLTQHRGPTPETTFGYVQWRWKTGMDEQDHDSADFDRAAYCKLFGREGSPLTGLPEESDTVEARNKPALPRRVFEGGQMLPPKNFRAGIRPSTPRSSQRLALRRISERAAKHQVTMYDSPAKKHGRSEPTDD